MTDAERPAETGDRPAFERGEITFIGTATVLIRYAGFTFLTDPNFLHPGDHARLGWGLRSKRLTNPAMEIDDLPPLDFAVLSHHHGDHFDDVAATRLPKTVPIISEPHAARKLRDEGFEHP
jgi:L-ascorbate metabolism protein UlaG (beta-lactamase superfamily)